jgi:hypothetical protein
MDLLLQVLVFVIVLGALFYIISVIPLPHPFGLIARIILGVVALIFILNILFGLLPYGPRLRPD